MAKTPAENIAEFLQTSGVNTLGTDMFVGSAPEDISLESLTIITLYDTGTIFSNPKFQRDEITIQILVKGPEPNIDASAYKTAYNKCLAVRDVLLGAANQTLDSATYTAFNQTSGITYLNQDSRGRPTFSMNYRITIDNQSGGNRTPL